MTDTIASTALIMIDVQNDFCPGGALAVAEGDKIIPVINSIVSRFGLIVAALDWHPQNHASFHDQGGPWPPHCVQGTQGAELHAGLDTSRVANTFRKATTPELDAYSEFEGQDEAGWSLNEYLRSKGIRKVVLVGLATDYCVKATALDALRLGYETIVVTDAVRAVNVNPGDGERALAEMRQAGAKVVSSGEIPGASGSSNATAAD